MSTLAWLALACAVVGLAVIGRSMFRTTARNDADEAQREIVRLLAEQADDRAIADNLNI